MKDIIQNNTIIICENNNKNKILKNIQEKKLFLNIKFYTKKEFFQEYYFSYDKKCIPYLINKYHLKYDIIQKYLDNLYYIEDKKYKSNKLNFLVNLKKELLNNNLIIYNNYFKEYIKNYQILVLGYTYYNDLEESLFKMINAKIITPDAKYDLNGVYKFKTMDEEIEFVSYKICELLNKGIDINKIKLMNVGREYNINLQRIFNFYHIPIKIDTNNNLYSNNIANIFLNNLDNGIEYSIEKIKNEDKNIVNKIISICNKYEFINDKNILKELIINDFKNTSINNFKLSNYIEIENINDIVNDDEYIFLLNFNTSSIPNYQKDEEYITDNIKDEVNLSNTFIINKKIKEYTISKLKSIRNLVITYKLEDNKNIYYPSILVSELNLLDLKYDYNKLISYSKEYSKIKLAKHLYNYETYGTVSDEYYLLKNNLNINYNTFNNEYTKIDTLSLKEYLNNKLTLSYSEINDYHKCAFKYYLAHILKLKKDANEFIPLVGSVLHDVLAKCLDSNISIDEEIDSYIKDNNIELSSKEKFFINLLKDDIKVVLEVIKEQSKDIKLKDALYEKRINIDKSRDISINFTGIIDKILYKEMDDKTIVSLIDYKSGNQDIDIRYNKYGFNLQLPIYLYLVSKSNLFNNPVFAGFYLQFILDRNIKISDTSYLDKLKDKLKLVGYSNIDENTLEYMDINYMNSNIIKGLICKNDGTFYKSAKVLSNDEINDIIKLVDDFITSDITKILQADFTINPKKIGYKKDIGCTYCPYYDICFKKDKDYVILDELGGTDDDVD